MPESTMLALMGHMSRAMLERYSHIRMAAKREAVKSLEISQKVASSSRRTATTKGTPKSADNGESITICKCLDSAGERGRNRTFNLVIKSHLLCQLSYAPALRG